LIEQRMECMDTTTSLPPTGSTPGTGRLKSSILSAITSCRVNGARGEFGQLRIETEELRRELAETRTRASVAEQRVADLTAMLDDSRAARQMAGSGGSVGFSIDRSAEESTPMVAMAALHARSGPPTNYARAGQP